MVGVDATGVDPASDEAFGTVLPDLASMAGTRLDRTGLPGAVAAGVAVHHRTDESFHRHPWFTHRMRADIRALDAAGLPRGAARACAHVGVELLLDGVLLRDRRVAGIVDELVGSLHAERLGAGAHRDGGWAPLFERLRGGVPADAYGSAEAVADRLVVTLSRRPRLAVGPEHRGALVACLAARRDDVATSAPEVLAEVVGAVRADSGRRRADA